MDSWELLLWVCSVLSYSVLVITCAYKFPQVYAILSSGSSRGISMASLLLEFTSYSIEMTYQYAMTYPFETYFEITLMWGQDVILLYVVLKNRNRLYLGLIPYFIIYCICFTFIAKRWLPNVIMYSLIGVTTPILISSKGTQLYKVLDTKEPGSLSALTWGLLSYMAAVRILTTVVITQDIPMFFNVTSSTIINIAITVSIIYYNRKKTARAQANSE